VVRYQLQGKAIRANSLEGNLDPNWRKGRTKAADHCPDDARHVRHGHGRHANATTVAHDAAATYGLRNATANDATDGPRHAVATHDAASHATIAANGLWTVANGHAATAYGLRPAADGNVTTANGLWIVANGNAIAIANGLRLTANGHATAAAHGVRTTTHGIRPAAPLLMLMKAYQSKHPLQTS
jgi:hypothetical protein